MFTFSHVGELLAHSGAVEVATSITEVIFVSGGADGMLAMWKDGRIESYKRCLASRAHILRWYDANSPEELLAAEVQESLHSSSVVIPD